MPDKLAGVIAMFSAIAVLFFLPWIDRNPVRSIRYRSAAYKAILFAFVISFLVLGYYGMQPVTPVGTWISRLGTLIYFGFFVALFFISKNESTKPVPERVRY